jgi:opacity protein-like surface antigen
MRYTLLIILALCVLACVPAKQLRKCNEQFIKLYASYQAMKSQRDEFQNIADTLSTLVGNYEGMLDRVTHLHKIEMDYCGCNIDSL